MKKPTKQYFTVITNQNLDTLDMKMRLSDHDEYPKQLHTHKLHNGDFVKVSILPYNKGYKFIFEVPFGTCFGSVLVSLRKFGKQWIQEDYSNFNRN